MRLFILAVLVACIHASPQYVKSRYSGVKGGQQYQHGENLLRTFNNTQTEYSHSNVNYEIGVCYIEVPTASLAKNRSHVPAGNGSRTDLSRIRTCCKGYIRNIHNFKICDPVCTNECVNGLCSAPETCSCFPDHVKNRAGFCVPTCPIGCQNGQCAGGECLCKNGYELDVDSKFCVPLCRERCGGIGNCTALNTCECRNGYKSGPEGSCKPQCEHCGNYGECVAPNECRCMAGFAKNPQGECIPQCADNCRPDGQCVGPNICHYPKSTTTTSPLLVLPYGGQNSQQNAGTYNNQQHSGYESNYNGQQSNYQHNLPTQTNRPDQQQTNNPGYQPNSPNRQPIYVNYDQQPRPNSESQYGNNNQYRPNSENQYGNINQQRPNSESNNDQLRPYSPGQHSNPNQATNNGNEPYYPGNQYYNQQHGINNNNSYPDSLDITQQSHNTFPDSQRGDVQTLCRKPCENGVCDGQGKCNCRQGYVLDESDQSVDRCTPYCPGGCPNGVCSSPYFCICNLGYHKDRSVKGRSNCVKRIRRSIEAPNMANLLIFEIPDDEFDSVDKEYYSS